MGETKGVIYILTNPSFPEYVKIGYANNMERRLVELNRSECTPYAFRVYATYAVESNLSDKRVHDIIDQLNPGLRAIDNFDGKQRKREFYAMSKEDAFSILEAIAEINGRESQLKIYGRDAEAVEQEKTAKEVQAEKLERLSPFTFEKCEISAGAIVNFACPGNAYDGTLCKVIDNKHVEYCGKSWSLSALATTLLESKHSVAGPCYFKYKGEWLNDIRARLEGRNIRTTTETWVIPCNPKFFDIFTAFKDFNVLEWNQNNSIQNGDTVYIYIGGEYKAIMYKCIADETELIGIGEEDYSKYYRDVEGVENRESRRYMKLRLVESFSEGRFPLSELKRNGLHSVQGPSRATDELREYLLKTQL